MSLAALAEQLKPLDPDAPLIWQTDAGPISGGYHVTELKLARVSSIDCGARQSAWTEARLQLLDGGGGDHMKLGRFQQILTQSFKALPDLANAPLIVEYAPENSGLHTFSVAQVSSNNWQVTIDLRADAAICKPAADLGKACCGPRTSTVSCCGAA
ncbi:hypothetical protein ACMU_05520 [Actibacterium mucosum KCTC 23349]|uniref:Uncharacterized protein n=1 Tax=Actibacterium mucosum KCTC 23349 TaxID=1454373 RepID=A0A037ZK01_9RHOB|nr:DUF6428 family protein [Actibacterium mucosum]KAJ56403.1 hypothetical protein ACMU_05520 [Actibacterium mucosum KCTC 23349]